MTCKEADKLIPLFVQNKLSLQELEEFIFHVENCEECFEELSIQYLITEGMVRLEDASAFDLKKELNMMLEEAKKKIMLRKSFQLLGITIEVMALISILAIILFLLI